MLSYARSNDKLKKLARDAQSNARAGTPLEAAKDSDALLLAVHWSRIDDVLKHSSDLSSKVIVTCSVPMDAGNTKLIIGITTSGADSMGGRLFETINRLAPSLRAGDLDACERAVIAQMQSLPRSPFHIAIDVTISNDPFDAARHFDRFFHSETLRNQDFLSAQPWLVRPRMWNSYSYTCLSSEFTGCVS